MCALEQQTHIDCLLTVSRIHVTAVIAENVAGPEMHLFEHLTVKCHACDGQNLTVKFCLLCHTNVFNNRL